MKQATGRRVALASSYKRQLKAAKEELETLLTKAAPDTVEVKRLKRDIEFLEKKIKGVPFIDTIDLRFNNRTKVVAPSTQAVMFCIMDVSGSMDEPKKDIAKRFFILLYLFLTRNYKKIEIVFYSATTCLDS